MRTTEDFHTRVSAVRRRLGISRGEAWFRGQRDITKPLLPSLLRKGHGIKNETNLYARFRQKGAKYIAGARSWELLAIMQHHGVPTRLLDWTRSLHVALFFAVAPPVSNPVLWVLNPFRLNQTAADQNVIFDDLHTLGEDYETSLRSKTWPFDLPVALQPPWTNERIERQQATFTCHGTNRGALEGIAPSRTVKGIPIPPHLARPLRNELERSGTTHATLFPGLDGLAKTLRTQFGFAV